MTSRSKKASRPGYTLLELLLVLGLCATFALVSVPALQGWWSEHRLRRQADRLVGLVQDARLQAEQSGRPQVVVLLQNESSAPEKPGLAVRALRPEGRAVWTLKRLDGGTCDAIGVDARGYVDPVSVRVAEGRKFVEYRFDFLTGHARETGASF